jgi:hypothetical protein
MKYFELMDDVYVPKRWHLGGLLGDCYGWEFVLPPRIPLDSPLRSRSYEAELQVEGVPIDYTTTSATSIPILSNRAMKQIEGMAQFDVFPISIQGWEQKNTHHMVHVWDMVDCFDEERSEFKIIQKDDKVRPDLAGDYTSVTKLIIDPKRTEGKHIFRIARLELRLIVSEEIKRRFEAAGVTGTSFRCVTED